MIKNTVYILAAQILVLGLSVTGNYNVAWAASPWKWEFALKRDIVQDSMVLPTAVYIDQERQQYYVADSGNNRLISFNGQGEMLNIFNAGKSLEVPFDMTRTSDGLIWVVEKGKNSLTRIDLTKRDVSPSTLDVKGKTVYPHRLESAGDLLFISDKGTGNIFSYTTDLKLQQQFICQDCVSGFVDFKIYDETVWALNQENKTIYQYDFNGTLKNTIVLKENIGFPVSIAVGPAGSIYALDRQGRFISVFDESGKFRYKFLRHGFARGELYYPIEIHFDPWGRICVVDEGNAKVVVLKR